MRVVLQRKLADVMDGVDLRGYATGDVIDLASADARLLIAEAWAIPDRRHQQFPHSVERRQPRPERKAQGFRCA